MGKRKLNVMTADEGDDGNDNALTEAPKSKRNKATDDEESTKAAAKSKGGNVLSHAKLGQEIEKVGQRMATALSGSGPYEPIELDTPTGLKLAYVEKVVMQLRSGKEVFKSKNFGPMYRNLMTEQDELFSTSTARDLLKGVLSKTGTALGQPAMDRLVQLMDAISKVRMPTRMVGFATASEKMQHPTSPEEAMFADPAKTAKKHADLDRRRRAAVLDAMKEKEEADGSPEDIARAGLRAAIAYTLNEMSAPITAGNVRPHVLHAQSGNFTPDELEQIEARDHLKSIYEGLGGTLADETGDGTQDAMGRDWEQQGFGPAPPSPFRSEKYFDEDAMQE